MTREVINRYDLAPGVYLDLVELVRDHKDYKGEVIHQEVVKRIVTGKNIPDDVLREVADWWAAGYIGTMPEKIQQYLHSVSADHLIG